MADAVQVLFRSVNKLLMDTATAEYLFCCDFFQEDTIFSELFSATLAVVESALAASLQVPHLLDIWQSSAVLSPFFDNHIVSRTDRLPARQLPVSELGN